MIEYINGGLSRHSLTKMIQEEKKERIQIVSQMVQCLKLKELGVHEFGQYMLSIENNKIQIVTPDKVYVKLLTVH